MRVNTCIDRLIHLRRCLIPFHRYKILVKDVSCPIRGVFCQPIRLCLGVHQINMTIVASVFHGFPKHAKMKILPKMSEILLMAVQKW